MRTTVQIQDGLLERAKREALARRCTLGAVIEDALRKALLGEGSRPGPVGKTRLTTFAGGGIQPGVNLDSNVELLDRMESS